MAQNPYGQPMVQKKKGKGVIVVLVILLVAALGTLAYFGFREGGFLRGTPSIVDATKMESLSDYAKRLELAGNPEAAAAVYALLPKGGGADLLSSAAGSFPLIQAMQDMDWFTALFGSGSSSKEESAQTKDALTELFGKLNGGK
jgi:hypothetical protein